MTMPLIILPDWTIPSVIFYIIITMVIFSITIADALKVSPLRYSKFRNREGVNSRIGMFLIYAIPLLVGYFFSSRYLGSASLVQWLVFAAIELHFARRCLEVVFVHRYSGPIDLVTVYAIATYYSFITGYAGYLHARTLPAPDSLLWLGAALYLGGEALNFGHHRLLARLRKNTMQYRIPQGGLFEYVACPHYLGEAIAWLGIALMSRHLFLYVVFLGTTAYLVERALRTQAWYREKFRDYPRRRKAIIPFLL